MERYVRDILRICNDIFARLENSTIYFFIQGLAAFLKAIGYLIPLMDAEYANYYTREVMLILIREFQSPDEEMKKIVLKVRANDESDAKNVVIDAINLVVLIFCR